MYDFAVTHSYLIPLLPLLAAMISGFFGARWLRGMSHWPIWIGVGCSAVLAFSLLAGQANRPITRSQIHPPPNEATAKEWDEAVRKAPNFADPAKTTWFNWAEAGDPQMGGPTNFLSVNAGAFIDPLTCIMLCVICGIGWLITVFAAGYMKGEDGYWRFFAYLGLFIFAMTVLVMADNFIMMYLGWEGVGLCSYLLIGYYFQKPAAREAAKKAFLVNRVGDFGFSIGIMLTFFIFGSVSFFGSGPGTHTGVLEMALHPTGVQAAWLPWIPFFLMLGAFGKSAQFPLYVWLPDAMEGPTPVSALIHAATMVTAGVYMIARCSTLFVGNAAAMLTIAVVGTFTAIFAATIALRQFDLKKVFAYSTVSQLGYMFAGMGFLAPVAGVFHLVTHAFFKALLFLGSGVVMHAMGGELDMRKMSGLKKVLPKTHILMLIGCLALAGFPFFSGFFSKDAIIAAAFNEHGDPAYRALGIVLLVAAFITAFYTFRLYFRVFQGPLLVPAGDGHGGDHSADHGHATHAHGSPLNPAAPAAGGNDAEQHAQAEHPHGEDAHHHNHEPAILILPLMVLAIGAVLVGYVGWPERDFDLGKFLEQSPSYLMGNQITHAGMNATELLPEPAFTPIMGISALIAITGVLLAFMLHLKNRAAADRMAGQYAGIARILDAKYWVDEVYHALIIEPLRKVGRIFFAIDRMLIDGVVWIVGFIPQAGGFVLKLTTQRGYLQGYAATMLLGIVVILLIMLCT